jgi:DNA modification methylase
MTPAIHDPDLIVYHGDALTILQGLTSESVHCVCTSPPYWGLRDYGTATWVGGDPDCDHRVGGQVPQTRAPDAAIVAGVRPGVDASRCLDCDAIRQDDQLGLERTPEEYVAKLVAVFREVRRVLRRDGTCWLNLGDSYASDAAKGGSGTFNGRNGRGENYARPGLGDLKPKDLVGVPWRVAFALQADGWYLRSDVIWAKPNPMPESVRDRPTSAHEHVFLLTRSPRYFYNADAIAEPAQDWTRGGPGTGILTTEHYGADNGGNAGLAALAARYKNGDAPPTRNARNVWEIDTQPFPGAHYAVMPGKLAARCIAAGTPEGGVCQTCAAPFSRAWEYAHTPRHSGAEKRRETAAQNAQQGITSKEGTRPNGAVGSATPKIDHGWQPTCTCEHPADDLGLAAKAIVLDPFFGAGTTGLVARRMGRACVGIELSADSVTLASERLNQLSLL